MTTNGFRFLLLYVTILTAWIASVRANDGEISVLLVTGGPNPNHNWEITSAAMEQRLLERDGLFSVETIIVPTDDTVDFAPDWNLYDVVVLDYAGIAWSRFAQRTFSDYVREGGGLVVSQAAGKAFPNWEDYNIMIGIGGGNTRNEEWGPRVHYSGGEDVRDFSPGTPIQSRQQDFLVTNRNFDHPVTRDLPDLWMHGFDQVETGLRGPARNLTLLATANVDSSDFNEPVLFTVHYGRGKIFHSALGHVSRTDKGDNAFLSVNNVDYITTMVRGTEWAATGDVSSPIPRNFPLATQPSYRSAPPPVTQGAPANNNNQGWRDLLNPGLNEWELFMGVPHSSVTGLPPGTFQSDDIRIGTPLGLNNDPKNVFRTRQEGGETILHITGEIYGGLTTLDTFENYHFRAHVRWGVKKWRPRLTRPRDSGILYHCQGEHGAFWNVWKHSLEYQVEEGNFGNFINVGVPAVKAPFTRPEGSRISFYDLSQDYQDWSGHLHSQLDSEGPRGEWNILDLYVVGNQAIHVFNNELVMSIKGATNVNGQALVRGQIQIQSEGAVVEYKRIKIRPLDAFPPKLRERTRL